MRANQFTHDAVERHKRNRYIRRLHQMTGWDTSHLELLSNDELKDLHIQHQQERDSKSTDEAMSASLRMQRALQREKEKRERSERYAEKHFPIGKPKEEPKKDQNTDEGQPTQSPNTSSIRQSVNDYNKERNSQQPIQSPNTKNLRQTVNDYNKERSLKEKDDESNSQRKQYPHYYKHKDAGTVFRVQNDDGQTMDITPDDEEWDDYYQQKFPDYPTPNDGGFWNDDNTAAMVEGICEVCGTSLAEHGKASLKLCKSSRPDNELGASNLASCKSQGLRARDGDKSHKLGKGPESRVKVGGHKIKGKKYGGPLPDWS